MALGEGDATWGETAALHERLRAKKRARAAEGTGDIRAFFGGGGGGGGGGPAGDGAGQK